MGKTGKTAIFTEINEVMAAAMQCSDATEVLPVQNFWR